MESELFREFKVEGSCIIPDRDDTGWAHTVYVCDEIARAGVNVRVINLPAGKDVTEWKEKRGGTVDQLLSLRQEPPLQPQRFPLLPVESSS